MSYDQATKERAYQLDPECWKSYSGKPVEFKRRMEVRRTDALRRADREMRAARPRVPDLETRLDNLEREVRELRKQIDGDYSARHAGLPGFD